MKGLLDVSRSKKKKLRITNWLKTVMMCKIRINQHRSYVGFILSFIFSSLLLQSCNERAESFYPLYNDAASAGAITRGWIPDFLPESSRDIHEMHDITSSRTWCTFKFSPDDAQRIQDVLTNNIDNLPPSVQHIDSPKMPWWPEFLEDDLDAGMIQEHGYTLYALQEPSIMDRVVPVLFAIDWVKGRGFFHRTYSQ